jgi:hypothetical protein
MKLILKQFAVVFIAVFLNLAINPTLLSAQSAIDKESRIENAVMAHFEESLIDLSKDWGEARACWSDGEIAECFRTESQMDDFLSMKVLVSITTSTCPTAVKLYSNTSYGGSVLSLVLRATTINLNAYGFDNLTSSYVIGACDTKFYDFANLGTPTYPGSTTANSSAATMLASWDNRVSSIRIS